MAEDKKSVLLYCDLIHTVEKLTNEQAGKLFKHYLKYINDLDPKTEDILIELVFEPIKQNLKRDLKKWEGIKEDRSINGREGNLKRWNRDLYDLFKKGEYTLLGAESIAKGRKVSPPDSTLSPPIANIAVNDTVTVTVNVKDITKTKEQLFLEDWNELRFKHLKKKSNIKMLSGDDRDNFKELSKQYNTEDFRNALIGLFKQKKLPNDNKVMQANPKHFLKYFNTYYTAYGDQNTALYGEDKKEY